MSSVWRPSRYSTPSGGQSDALLQGHPHALPAPLRHRHAHGELQRVDGVGVDGVVAGARGRRPARPTGRSPGRRRGRGSRPGGSRRRRRCPAGRAAARAAASTSLPVRPTVSAAVVRSCIRLPVRSAARSPAGAHGLAGSGARSRCAGCRSVRPEAGQPDVAVHQVAGLDHRVVATAGSSAPLPWTSGTPARCSRPSAGTTARPRGRGSAAGSTRRRRAPSSSRGG